jgi:hypothetical protein
MGNLKAKRNYRRTVLRLPDLDHSKAAVLNSLSSPGSRRVYRYAIEQFIAWYCSEPRLAFNRIVVVRYRMYLEGRGLAANTINQQLAAVRRLAHEAADAGLLSPELAAGQSCERRQATRVSFGELAHARPEHGSPEPSVRRRCTRQARLCHAGHVARLWTAPIRVGRSGDSRSPNPPGALGHCGPDRQGPASSHRADSGVGETGARPMDHGSGDYRGKDFPRCHRARESPGQRHLPERGVVRGKGLLQGRGPRAHRAP